MALCLGLRVTPAVRADHHVNDTWKGSVETPRGTRELTFDFMEEDGKLTGKVTTGRGESEIEDGKVEGTAISFKQTMSFQGREIVFSYSGTVDGDEIAFTREVEGRGRSSEFTAKRAE